jgi:hypothetical protein
VRRRLARTAAKSKPGDTRPALRMDAFDEIMQCVKDFR